MNPAEFKKKWSRYQGKETSAYQGHFDDLCRLLGQQTPAEADPSGSDFFCFQKRVVKDAELFDLETPDASAPEERGFADVWKKGCFAWEYKGKKKNLDDAYKQLLRYRESLLNPPLLVVCDFDRYIIRTNFNGTVQETHEFTNDQIDRPENMRILRALFSEPEFLKPQRTTAQVTEQLAQTIAEVAKSLQKREAAELADAKTRAEMNFAQRKNLRIARFLNRIVFCFFAEDTGLLPKGLFSDLLKTGIDDLKHFAKALENLFAVMARGGQFGKDKIRHFNGHLFEESTVFELEEDELRKLADAGEADWQFIEPSIMGTLFERALEPEQRSQLGAHYTSEADIKTLVEPVLMAPLRSEWSALKEELAPFFGRDAFHRVPNLSSQTVRDTVERVPTSRDQARDQLAAFQKKLAAMTVLDPACGSGNFLYVSLQLLLGLEKEVVTYATQLGFKLSPQVGVQQLRAIEINPYAFELAQVSVQIGFLQWRRDNGFDNDRSPVLQNLDGFQNEDALLVPHFRSKAKSLKEAQASEHAGDDALKFYTEREWPKCDVIVSNPPFLGGSRILDELGKNYQAGLFTNYGSRVSGFADLCCYWFEKAREHIERKNCKRAGLLATNSIRQGANRRLLSNIKTSGDIFFAESDRDWILDGASLNVSMVGFDDGTETCKILDGKSVPEINADLTAATDLTRAMGLTVNQDVAFYGSQQKAQFDVPSEFALGALSEPNPAGKPNSDVLRPALNAAQLLRRTLETWVIDFGLEKHIEAAASYDAPFRFVKETILPVRKARREVIQQNVWWLHARPSPRYRVAATALPRLIVTPAVSKFRLFVAISSEVLFDHRLVTFSRADDYFYGVLSSRLHVIWSLKLGSTLEDRPCYTPSTCFETFPFPRPTPAQETAIAAAAKELNELRERWLNPPEWTETRTLEFPGTVGGPWDRYIVPGSARASRAATDASSVASEKTPTGASESTRGGACAPQTNQVGTVRYPRLEPRDADCAAKLKKRTLTNLYNERPAWLDLAHKKLDAAVAAAYGWPADLTDEQILERLLALNLERAAEEAKAAKEKKTKVQRGKAAEELV